MNPNDIDTSFGVLAAQASSEAARVRWSELRVYYFPNGIAGGAKCWLAEAIGRSAIAGEVDKIRRLPSASLDRALRLFDDSDLGRSVQQQAQEFAEDHGIAPHPIDRQQVPETDRDALAWLYGVEADDLSVNAAAADLGIGESSIRMAIRDDRPVRVPLRALLPFIDRRRFQAASAKESDCG